MPLVVFDEVALMNGATAATPIDPYSRSGNVLFGRVVAVDVADVDVLWENGQFTQTIPNAAGGPLDKIAQGVAAPLVGRVVYPQPPAPGSANTHSPEYRCLVVRVYTRQRNGEGAEVGTFALLKNLSTGQVFEALTSNISVVDGQ